MPFSIRIKVAPLLALFACACAVALASPAAPAAEARSCQNAQKKSRTLAKKKVRGAIRCLVNKERSARNLDGHGKLADIAQSHTRRMRKQNCFSHQCSGEASLESRLRKSGYLNGADRYTFGEVIALSRRSSTPRDVVRQWMGSSSHRSAILHSGFEHIGIGVSVGRRQVLYDAVLASRSG